jgi:hypothetical protein
MHFLYRLVGDLFCSQASHLNGFAIRIFKERFAFVSLNVLGFLVEGNGPAKDFRTAKAGCVAQAVELVGELFGHADVESLTVEKSHGATRRERMDWSEGVMPDPFLSR